MDKGRASMGATLSPLDYRLVTFMEWAVSAKIKVDACMSVTQAQSCEQTL
jgi:hypothetical protein